MPLPGMHTDSVSQRTLLALPTVKKCSTVETHEALLDDHAAITEDETAAIYGFRGSLPRDRIAISPKHKALACTRLLRTRSSASPPRSRRASPRHVQDRDDTRSSHSGSSVGSTRSSISGLSQRSGSQSLFGSTASFIFNEQGGDVHLPLLQANIARLKTFQEQLEAEENQVHTHMELLQQRQDRLTRDLNMSLPPTATSAGPSKSPRQDDAFDMKNAKIQCWLASQQLEREMGVVQRQKARVGKMKAHHSKIYDTRTGMWLSLCLIARSAEGFFWLHCSRHARGVLQWLMFPRLRIACARTKQRVARALLTKAALPRMSKPTVAELQATNLFSSWPDVILQRLRRNLVPVALRRGEFAVLAGDPGVVMYIIDHGCVEVLIQNPATDGKRRAPGIKVAELYKRGTYFGEFTVLVEEPRMASVRATETTHLWALHKVALQFWVSKLPGALQQEARDVADERRRINLGKLHPLTPSVIKKSAMFRMWTLEQCQALAAKCKPQIFYPGEVMMREGDPGAVMYFLVQGEAHIFSDYQSACEKLLHTSKPHDIVGEVALLYREARSATVVADRIVECWALAMEHFHDLMMSSPGAFLAAKELVNQQRAARIAPLPMRVLLTCPLVPRGFRTAEWGRRLSGLMRPRVCDATCPVTRTNVPITEILFCLQGDFGDAERHFSTGSIVGLHEFFGGMPHWPYTLKARSKVELWVLPIESCQNYLKSNEKMCAVFCKSMGSMAAKMLGSGSRV